MNIVIITPIYPPDLGGPAIYSYEISRRLSQRGHRVKVATLTASAQGPDVYVIRPRRLKFPALLYSYLVSFISLLKITKGCDLVYDQNPSLLGLASLLAARLLGKPVVTRFPGVTTWEKVFQQRRTTKYLEAFLRSPEGGIVPKIMLRLQRFLLKRVDKVIVPSHFLKEVLTSYYQVKPGKIAVIYNSIDGKEADVVSSSLRQAESPKLIAIARLTNYKRVDRIIRAAKELTGQYPQLRLQIVGEGPERERLQALAKELGIEGQVEFRGQLSHQETLVLLRGADIFILNSVYEGSPHTVVEAMVCRTAVIATNIRGTDEVVKTGETGLLVEVASDTQLKGKIALLLEDKELRQRLVDKAYHSVMENFTWHKNLPLLEKELEGVLRT